MLGWQQGQSRGDRAGGLCCPRSLRAPTGLIPPSLHFCAQLVSGDGQLMSHLSTCKSLPCFVLAGKGPWLRSPQPSPSISHAGPWVPHPRVLAQLPAPGCCKQGSDIPPAPTSSPGDAAAARWWHGTSSPRLWGSEKPQTQSPQTQSPQTLCSAAPGLPSSPPGWELSPQNSLHMC